MNEKKLKNRLIGVIVTVVLLICGLTITSVALVNSIVNLQNNRFTMSMGVDLNGGLPVMDMNNIVYEPGGRYQSTFPISNNGTFDVWYRVYFTEVDGTLKDYITVTVKEEDGRVLCSGKMHELEKKKVSVGTLAAGEEKNLCIEFYFSPDADNSAQGQSVYFNITADAVQTQNNQFADFGD